MHIDELGDRLKALAPALRIELQEPAGKGGVMKATFSGYVSGDRLPRADTPPAWHKETHVDLHWLLTGEGEMVVSGSERQPRLRLRLFRIPLPGAWTSFAAR